MLILGKGAQVGFLSGVREEMIKSNLNKKLKEISEIATKSMMIAAM